MEATKGKMTALTTPYYWKTKFNERGFRMNDDDVDLICCRLDMLIERMVNAGIPERIVGESLYHFMQSTFDYFLMKKEKKNVKSVMSMWDRTQTMKKYGITTEDATKEWKRIKKEIKNILEETATKPSSI